jgi:predicted GNAT superfamily acetyltransferase
MSRGAAVDIAVEIRSLESMADFTSAADALRSIWAPAGGEPPLLPEVMRAIAFSGGYVAGAFADAELVGASVGFIGVRDGELHLHSHISGVRATWQGRHVGLALKSHQRDWALARGIGHIEWTFDPLVRRNAFFNLAKLGAAVVGYEPDFYGPMDDAFNAGDFTDRGVVLWSLAKTPRTADENAPVILSADDKGGPLRGEADGPALRAWIPEDIVAVRQSNQDTARAWRLALRETFGAAIRRGYAATAMTRDGWYTLERTSS